MNQERAPLSKYGQLYFHANFFHYDFLTFKKNAKTCIIQQPG